MGYQTTPLFALPTLARRMRRSFALCKTAPAIGKSTLLGLNTGMEVNGLLLTLRKQAEVVSRSKP
jgi:hypothetical protein